MPVHPVDDGFWDDGATLRACLAEPVPRIPPVFGYDERGSQLFEDITRLPTYHLTRAEWNLIRRHADDIAARLDTGRIVELGSGSAKKTLDLLAACVRRRPTTYLPVDVSREMLETSEKALTAALPGLTVAGLWGRYERALAHLGSADGDRCVVAFLGSNIGNATAAERRDLLAAIAAALRPGDGFLVSIDLLKPTAVFDTCYNDPPGYSAFVPFRLNHLTHVNRRFGSDFNVGQFRALAHFDEPTGVVEGNLYALADQDVAVPGLGVRVQVPRGGSINVGFSAKFDLDGFEAELASHGMSTEHRWVDAELRYGILLARAGAGCTEIGP